VSFLNLGIVAHVDAGKTSLTERLLYAGGVLDTVGSVDAGTTRTDSLDLERRRGITIKTAVASFPAGGVTVNLIDTPGHPDFIAEVERALRVLDGAILVISAVEGVQAQTRVLLRTLRRLRVPTLLFVNKIDRAGARSATLLAEIAAKLTPDIVAVTQLDGLGTPAASARPLGPGDPSFVARLVEISGDDGLLAAYVGGGAPQRDLLAALTRRVRAAEVHPVFFGSAATGAGVDTLLGGLAELLPVAAGDPAGPLGATVFKVERGTAYVRMFSGTLRARDRTPYGVVTGIDGGRALTAGEIGRVHGLRDVRIGDVLGDAGPVSGPLFAPPTLQSVVVPRRESERHALHTALTELAAQDPLINLRADLTVSLYGEVQKEVIETTLAEQYGIEVSFRETSTIYVERPAGRGRAGATFGDPYPALLELLVEPATESSFALEVPIEQVPIHVYKTRDFFVAALADAARDTLANLGVIGARVTVTRTGFISPITSAGHFRKLMPLVLAAALRDAGTMRCEPMHRFRLEAPASVLGSLLGALTGFGAVPEVLADGAIGGLVPAARLRSIEQAVPGLTHGEGVLESAFESYRPLTR
jgi:ribosomal protection tetracycline resistance protein